MKKFILWSVFPSSYLIMSLAFCLYGAIPAQATTPWGVVDAYIEESPDYTQIIKSHHIHFALYKLITGTPVRYAMEFEQYEGQTPATDTYWKQQLISLIQQAFATWPEQTRSMIHASGRNKEFKDIARILNRSMQYEEMADKEQADIIFRFVNHKGAAFYYNTQDLSEQKSIRIPNPAYFGKTELKKIPNFLIHEIGHYYGLGDRYQEGIQGNSVTYSTTGDTDGDSVMASNLGTQLTCDDIDGFINLIDLTQFVSSGKWNKRARKGWQSTCGPQKIYRQGKELNRKAFFDGHTIYSYHADGTVKAKKEVRGSSSNYNPFASANAPYGSFTGLESLTDPTTDIQTLVNYNVLSKQGRFFGKSYIANLDMLSFEGIRQQPRQWKLNLIHLRNLDGTKKGNISQQQFAIQLTGNNCHIRAFHYISSIPQIDTLFDLSTGIVSASATLLDLSSADNNSITLQIKGTIDDESYSFQHEKIVHTCLYKEDQIYWDEEEEEMERRPFFVLDSLTTLHAYLKNAQGVCRYLSALESKRFAP